MKFSLIKNKYIKISLSLLFSVVLGFFLFNMTILANNSGVEDSNKDINEQTEQELELDQDEIDYDDSEEKVLISQNLSYLSPNVVYRIKSQTVEKRNNINIGNNSFSIPNRVVIDFKNPEKIKNNPNNNSNKINYIVKTGDTLDSIAKKFGITISTIKVENNISGNKLKEKQILRILPTSGFIYKVRRGDTISSIANRYNSSEDKIYQYNFLDKNNNNNLKIGQELLIPVEKYYQNNVQKRTIPKRKKVYTKPKIVKKKQYNTYKKTYPISGTTRKCGGYYINPAPGSVKTQGIHGRNAVDLASRGHRHTRIVAAASGRVQRARTTPGYYGGYGMNVLISHSNGSRTLYAHMSKVIVYNGQYVKKGQTIGYMGSTGRSTGVHLHFEIRNGCRNPF